MTVVHVAVAGQLMQYRSGDCSTCSGGRSSDTVTDAVAVVVAAITDLFVSSELGIYFKKGGVK